MSVYAARLRLGALLFALTAVVSGCGGDPPAPPPFTPATAASSPTATGPVEPVLPEAANAPTAAGAEAFAKFYWETVNYAQATGDTAPVRAVSASTCQPCASSATAIEGIYADGGVVRGGEYTVTSSRAFRLSSQHASFRLAVRVTNDAQEIDYPGTNRDESLNAGTSSVRMYVDFLQGRWVAAVVEPVS